MNSLPQSASRGTASVFVWTAVAVGVFHALLYAGALWQLMTDREGFRNAFSEVALEHHMDFLVWTNLDLLKGYGLLWAATLLAVYPLTLWWTRSRVAGRGHVVTRRAIGWRAFLLCCGLLGFFVMRLLHVRPYFIDPREFGKWYYVCLKTVLNAFPDIVYVIVFDVLPVVLVAAGAGFYLDRTVRFFFPDWGGGKRLATIGLAGLIGIATWKAAPAALSPSPAPETPSSGDRPLNVLVVASDSLRADHLSCNGYARETTPRIDELAEKSVNFTKCFTPIGSTLESMTSMMTSQYPHTHGLRHMYPGPEEIERLQKNSPFLASILAEQGYDTAAIGDWCAGIFNVAPMGFEDVDVSDYDNLQIYMSQAIYLRHWVIPLFFDNRIGYSLFPKLESFAMFVTPDVVTRRVEHRLAEQAESGRPFFWTVFYSCTHLTYRAPAPYCEMWTDPEYSGPHKYSMAFDVDEFITNVDASEKWKSLPEEDLAQIIGLYDGCVTEFDDCVGRILDQLEATGLAQDTIVIVTSDHGDDLFEPNVTFGHGLTFNGGDQSNNVPCVFYVPGAERNARRIDDRIVRTIDFGPTVLDLVGAPPSPSHEGSSLLPYFTGIPEADLSLPFYGETSYLFFKRSIPGEEVLHIPPLDQTCEFDPEFDYNLVLKDDYEDVVVLTKERALRTLDYKLVYTPGVHHPIHRLYNLDADPFCERDVKDEEPEAFAAMHDALWRWIDHRQQSTIRDIFPDPLAQHAAPDPAPAVAAAD